MDPYSAFLPNKRTVAFPTFVYQIILPKDKRPSRLPSPLIMLDKFSNCAIECFQHDKPNCLKTELRNHLEIHICDMCSVFFGVNHA